MKATMRNLLTVVGIGFRADPPKAIGAFVLTIINSLTTVSFALWLTLLTDGAVNSDRSDVWRGVFGMVATMVVFQVTNWLSFNMRNTLMEKTAWVMDRRLIEMSAGIPGLEHHERPDYITELELLRQDRHQLSFTIGTLVNNLDTLVQMVGTMFVLSRLHPVLLLLPLFAVPSVGIAARAVKLQQTAMEKTRELGRSADHLFELSTTPGPAKETRIFALAGPLVRRHQDAWMSVDKQITKASMKVAWLTTLGWTIFALGYTAGMAFVVKLAVDGRTSAGGVLLAFTLGAQVNQQVGQAVGGVSWLLRNLKTVGRYVWLQEYTASAWPKDQGRLTPPDRLERGIELKDVSFKYPGTDSYVLKEVNLYLPAGTTVAVVGDNGAGKTTLIKLLCRFYRPTEGQILADGQDIDRFDPEQWRNRMSAGFQDFARFEFHAGEVVGVGDIPRIDDAPILERALVRGGATDVIAALPSGLATQLGKSFDEGVELSGGQWQKLALGRSMMRDPLLLVLDEPTASLDANTEHALFERFAAASDRVARASGAITVLVSHRFSTVRMADLIVVVEGGRVLEIGSHKELIEREGLYADLFEMQARAYR